MQIPDRIHKNPDIVFYIFILLYTFIHILFITDFPFVHSDESWLSGLSRNILSSKDLSVTEPFFNLYPRNPHAIKTLFHLIQGAVIQVFGYSLFNMRLISLAFGVLFLYFFYKTGRYLFSPWISLLATSIFAWDIQFIYASHFARQENLLVFVFMAVFYYHVKHMNHLSKKHAIISGLVIGTSIGIHPNSFIIALPFVFIYAYLLLKKKRNGALVLSFIATLGIFAFFFIVLSFSFNPTFISDYTAYGQTLGVTNSLPSKFIQLKDFFLKLYYGISGTYYTPNIKFQFVLFVASLFLSLFVFIKDKNQTTHEFILLCYLSIAGILCGIILIGRFNATSIIFLFPLLYLLLFTLLTKIPTSIRITSMTIILLMVAMNSAQNIYPYTQTSYGYYLDEIGNTVPKDSIVLANLNCEYYFDNHKLLDYRNLAYLEENKMTFSDFIRKNHIAYIIYPEEMDFIYNNRPVYNGIYGNLYPYYEDMQQFLQNNCLLMDSFYSHYGMRISRYFLDKEWHVKIYQVKPD